MHKLTITRTENHNMKKFSNYGSSTQSSYLLKCENFPRKQKSLEAKKKIGDRH